MRAIQTINLLTALAAMAATAACGPAQQEEIVADATATADSQQPWNIVLIVA